jgi:hypothetical protein
MTNEKAFPNPHLIGETGMTLRDYFAAKAMQNVFMTGGDDDERRYIAMHAYKMADAMMEARK